MGKQSGGDSRTADNNAGGSNSSKSRTAKAKSGAGASASTGAGTGGNRRVGAQNGGTVRNVSGRPDAAGTGAGAPKRKRPSGGGRDTKRLRAESGTKGSKPRKVRKANTSPYPSQTPTHTPTRSNQSPVSSRSRQWNQAKRATSATAMAGDVSSAAVKEANQVNNMNKVNESVIRTQPGVGIGNTDGKMKMDGMVIPSGVKNVNVVRRLFGQEIQCLMHAFGEVRACSRDTLELVEDAVRVGVRAVIAEANRVAVLMVTEAGLAISTTSPVLLEAAHIAHVLRRNWRMVNRLNQSIRLAAEQYGDRPEANELRKLAVSRAAPQTDWELVAELCEVVGDENGGAGGSGSAAAASSSASGGIDGLMERRLVQDEGKKCTWSALRVFRDLMGPAIFGDFLKCRRTTLVTGVSRSHWGRIARQPRHMLFQRWLDLKNDDDVKLSLGAVYALGHVAWECIGVLTQTALVQMHSGVAGFPTTNYSSARHVLSALGHGVATAVLLPLPDLQMFFLKQEVEKIPSLGRQYWRQLKSKGADNATATTATTATTTKAFAASLRPHHIKEALRTNHFSDNVLLSFMRGTYPTNSY